MILQKIILHNMVVAQNVDLKNKKKKTIPQALREQVWRAHFNDKIDGSCNICNKLISVTNFDCSHIISEFNGGDLNLNNLIPLCKKCNTSMGTNNYEEFKKLFCNNIKDVEMKIDPLTEKINNYLDESISMFNSICISYKTKDNNLLSTQNRRIIIACIKISNNLYKYPTQNIDDYITIAFNRCDNLMNCIQQIVIYDQVFNITEEEVKFFYNNIIKDNEVVVNIDVLINDIIKLPNTIRGILH